MCDLYCLEKDACLTFCCRLLCVYPDKLRRYKEVGLVLQREILDHLFLDVIEVPFSVATVGRA